MIGVRLKLARRAAGLSLRDLADAIDGRVTAQAIGRYERNEAMPGSDVLIALAGALDASVDYLLGDPELVLEDLAFRKDAFATRRSEARVEAAVLARLERYLAIEDILGLSSLDWNKSRDVPYPVFRNLTDASAAPMLSACTGVSASTPFPASSNSLRNKASRSSPYLSTTSVASPPGRAVPGAATCPSSSEGGARHPHR